MTLKYAEAMIFRDKFYEILQNPHGSLLERGRLARLLRNKLPVFVVNSGNWAKFPELTLTSANEFPAQFSKLAGWDNSKFVDFDETFPESTSSQKLASLFDSFGSDKSSHGYERIYSSIFSSWKLDKRIELLEIGIGTNSPGLISSMGRKGKPGASLWAFSRYSENINITGADIDRDILFDSARIHCYFLDQTNLDAYHKLCESSGVKKFDLIIDDGLHSTHANINSLIFAQSNLTLDGYLIIEDIPDRSLPVWHAVIPVLESKGCEIIITRATKCNVVIFRKTF